MSQRAGVIATALTLCCAPTLVAAVPTAGAAGSPEDAIRAVLAAHEQALNAHDIEALLLLYAPGQATVLMGTTAPERWLGGAEIADAYLKFFKDFDAGTVERDCPWMQIDTSGDIGWISAICEYQDSLAGQPRSFALNLTAVMQRLDDTWMLRTMHFSNPTGPLDAPGDTDD